MENKKPAVITPMYIETNAKVEKLMQIMKRPETRREYGQILKKLESDPQHVAQKLRRTTWAGKTVRDIATEL